MKITRLSNENTDAPIAIVTCSTLPRLSLDDRLLGPELARRGVAFEPVIWNDPGVRWERYRGILIRSPWDYMASPGRFRTWLDQIERLGVPVWNPVSLLRWNFDKVYLREFEARNIPIVPTLWIDREAPQAPEIPWSEFVIKPSVSAGARKTYRLRRDVGHRQRAERLVGLIARRSTPMIQPYLKEIESEGEWSFLFFSGQFSHAVVKRPTRGDFRVQEAFGGVTEAVQASESMIAPARRALECLPAPHLYARVDMIPVDGRLLLGEMEVFEPSLYLKQDPRAASRFAEALKIALAGSSPSESPGNR